MRRAAQEREIRRTVTRLSGCLDALAPAERRVLKMRAGTGERPARTRQGVARILDKPVARVRRLEVRGLRKARAEARTDGCATAGAGTTLRAGGTGATLVTAGDVGPPTPDTAVAGGGTAAGGSSGGGDVRGGGGDPGDGGAAGSGESGDVRSDFESRIPGLPDGPATITGGTGVGVALALMMLALAAGFATPSLQQRLRGR